jgi:hypothetical protein
MITANALDHAAHTTAETLTKTPAGTRAAQTLLAALKDYQERADLADQAPAATLATIAETLANALTCALTEPAELRAKADAAEAAERETLVRLHEAEAAHADARRKANRARAEYEDAQETAQEAARLN